MLRIAPRIEGNLAILVLSGRIEDVSLSNLDALIKAQTRPLILDLKEVTLAGQAGVRFLAQCEETGVGIRNCPAYIREWISRERGTG